MIIIIFSRKIHFFRLKKLQNGNSLLGNTIIDLETWVPLTSFEIKVIFRSWKWGFQVLHGVSKLEVIFLSLILCFQVHFVSKLCFQAHFCQLSSLVIFRNDPSKFFWPKNSNEIINSVKIQFFGVGNKIDCVILKWLWSC